MSPAVAKCDAVIERARMMRSSRSATPLDYAAFDLIEALAFELRTLALSLAPQEVGP